MGTCAPMLYSLRSLWQSARVSAVLPEPTGLMEQHEDKSRIKGRYEGHAPSNSNGESALLEVPCAVVGHVALRVLPCIPFSLRIRSTCLQHHHSPGLSRCSCVCPCSPSPWSCECAGPPASCVCVCGGCWATVADKLLINCTVSVMFILVPEGDAGGGQRQIRFGH